jgi:hypothetical protein
MKRLPLLLATAVLAASSPARADTVTISTPDRPSWDAGGHDWSWLRDHHDWSWDRHDSWHDHDPGDPRDPGDPPGGSAGAAVPEASTWAMMLAGFAGLGAVTWRRTRKPRLAGL